MDSTTGDLYLAGATTSDDFPIVDGPFPFLSGTEDAFVTRLSSNASTIEFSTYFGGSNGATAAHAVAIDADDTNGDNTDDVFRIYIAGSTSADDLRVRDALYPFISDGDDGFIARFDADNTGDAILEYATYFGGGDDDLIEQLAIIEPAGDPLFAGVTESSDLPNKHALQPQLGGGVDLFVGRIARGGSELIFSTFLGGEDDDILTDLSLDANGHYLIAGYSDSTDWPVTEHSLMTQFPNGGDEAGVLARLDKTGRFLHFSTYLGANNDDRALSIAPTPDPDEGIYVAGSTDSTLFPLQNPYQHNLAGDRDGFLSRLDPSGQTLEFSTYFGGSAHDEIIKVRTDQTDGLKVYFAGETEDDGTGSSVFTNGTDTIAAPDGGGAKGGFDTFISHFTLDETVDLVRPKPTLWLDTDLTPIHPTGVDLDGNLTWDPINFALSIDDRAASTNRQVIGFTTSIYYDAALLQLDEPPITWAGSVQTDTDQSVDTSTDGVIHLRVYQNEAAADIEPIVNSAHTDGKIADIHFTPVADPPEPSQQVSVRVLERGSSVVEGDLDDIIYGRPGARYIERRCNDLLGDCDCSGQVQVFEVQQAVTYALLGADPSDPALPICLASDYDTANAAGELGAADDLNTVIANYIDVVTESGPPTSSGLSPEGRRLDGMTSGTKRQIVGRLDFDNPRPSGNQVSYDLVLNSATGPTVLVADLIYTPSQVAALSIAPGASASGADKDVQLNIIEPGWARIVIYGYNQTTINSGTLARLDVTLAAGQGWQSLDLQIIAEVSSRRVRNGRLASNRVENGQPTEASADQRLSVTVEDGGSVVSSPAGIDCGSTCSALFPQGQTVTLRATAETDYAFNGWTGACYGSGDCKVSMTVDREVTARFVRTGATSYDLNLTKTGRGRVLSDPAGIDCGADCSQRYGNGTEVSLRATPEAGHGFDGWSGACSGSDRCVLDMTADRSVSARFSALDPSQQSLTVITNGDGRVTSQPAGIDCGTDCTHAFTNGTRVALAATPATGAFFFGWSGACSESGTCEIEMNQAQRVTATFSSAGPARHSLMVAKAGNGDGAITSEPAGIDCGSDCSESYAEGTSVTLTAAPDTSSTFFGWSGACSQTGTCVVDMSTARQVTATFNRAAQSCPHDDELSLANRTITDSQQFSACRRIRAGRTLRIASTAHVTLEAGQEIELQSGLSVATGAQLQVKITPSLNAASAVAAQQRYQR